MASSQQGAVPKDWRSANVVPVFKKGNCLLAANYQPILLTSICSKVLKHIIYKQIMAHCEKHNILVNYQHGFRKSRSCETQLITVREEIAKWKDDRHNVDMLIMDFSKAFDTVPHQRLLRKLESYGIYGNLGNWLRHWLMARTQTVMLDGEASSPVNVKSGLPQGIVLGRLMFLLYINDIGPNITNSKVKLFADDCLLYRIVDSKEDESKFRDNLTELQNLADKWQMSFNTKKCHLLSVQKKGHHVNSQYKLYGNILEIVEHHPYLGVELQSDLEWDHKQITGKATRSLTFLRRNLSRCPEQTKERAYAALVRPHVEFASAV